MPKRRKNPLPPPVVPPLVEGMSRAARRSVRVRIPRPEGGGYRIVEERIPHDHHDPAERMAQGSIVLRERLDTLRQQCMAAARRLEMGAALEAEHARYGLPQHLSTEQADGGGAGWKRNAEAVARWLRGEAETLYRLGEGLS